MTITEPAYRSLETEEFMKTSTTASISALQEMDQATIRKSPLAPVARQLFSVNYARPIYRSEIQISYFWALRNVVSTMDEVQRSALYRQLGS
jgi:hypothetical protein